MITQILRSLQLTCLRIVLKRSLLLGVLVGDWSIILTSSEGGAIVVWRIPIVRAKEIAQISQWVRSFAHPYFKHEYI